VSYPERVIQGIIAGLQHDGTYQEGATGKAGRCPLARQVFPGAPRRLDALLEVQAAARIR
jgi:hypothetical protein